MALGNLGAMYWALGDFGKAFELYNRTVELAREIGDVCGEGYALYNISLGLKKIGQLSEAIQRGARAVELLEQVGDPLVAQMKQKIDSWRKGR
jgi:tetratricopeptide (TPR) repeat protein